jgi:hypothetical protein
MPAWNFEYSALFECDQVLVKGRAHSTPSAHLDSISLPFKKSASQEIGCALSSIGFSLWNLGLARPKPTQAEAYATQIQDQTKQPR